MPGQQGRCPRIGFGDRLAKVWAASFTSATIWVESEIVAPTIGLLTVGVQSVLLEVQARSNSTTRVIRPVVRSMAPSRLPARQ